MPIPSLATSDTMATLRTTVNTIATSVGDLSLLDSGITSSTNPDDLVQAINYVYSLAVADDTSFVNPVTFQSTLTTIGNAEFNGNLNIDGALTFDNVGVALTSIIDDDTFASASAVSIATSESTKAYVDGLIAAVDAITLDGIDSSAFMRSNASDAFSSDINIDFGADAGGMRIVHNSTDNATYFRPHNGSSFDATDEFGYDSDLGYWFFDDELRVNGLFTTRGIDDNATANRVQIEDSAITLKTATEIQGAITTSGNLTGGSGFTIDNGLNEKIVFASGTVSLQVDSTTRVQATTTGAQVTGVLGVSGAATLSSTLSVTGAVTLLNASFVGPTALDINNGSGEAVLFAVSTVSLQVNNTTRIQATASGCSVTGAITATGDVTAFSSDERLKKIVDYNLLNDSPLETLSKIKPVAFFWNENMRTIDPTASVTSLKVGVLAQNIEETFPVAMGPEIETLETNYKTVKYEALIPLIIGAIQELNERTKT